MTATDELRHLLDERGIEWMDCGEGSTLIPTQDAVPRAWTVNRWPSSNDMGDCLWVQNRHPLTPEQAVEATLGSDLQAENAKLRELLQRTWNAFHNATAREFVTVKNELRELGIEVDA